MAHCVRVGRRVYTCQRSGGVDPPGFGEQDQSRRVKVAAAKGCDMRTARILLGIVACTASLGADWPMYRGSPSRSGYVPQQLPGKLDLIWKRRSVHPPQRAWPRSKRQLFDACYQPVICGGRVFFGSSVDGSVRCLDGTTGRQLWQCFTGAPIRFAPVAWADRVAVASDDGRLYVLEAETGSVVWVHRGGPRDAWRLGNERMVSKWPARGGPVLLDGILYYAAGIWPSDGIYIYALQSTTGEVVWSNTDSGGLYMAQPHGGANAASGLAAQGHLSALGKRLFVPTGRAIPAALDRSDGKLAYFYLQKNRAVGGTSVVLTERYMVNSGVVFDALSGEARGKLKGRVVSAFPGGLLSAAGGEIHAVSTKVAKKPDRKGKLKPQLDLAKLWTEKGLGTVTSLIVAGDTVVAGGAGHVDGLALGEVARGDRRQWQLDVDGAVYGLAVADDKLYVATDHGTLYCFGTGGPQPVANIGPEETEPYKANPLVTRGVEEILRTTRIREGYCLDLGCGDGQLAYELAKRTDLTIFAVDNDRAMVREARRKLAAAGFYGDRVTVHYAPLQDTGYPQYFANLIVSARALEEELEPQVIEEVSRLQRPYGGEICLGKVGELELTKRGALAGAGSWTHQYSNPANTVSSDDALVKGKLGILWFRDVGLELPQRHGRGPAPLFHEGRLFHEGLDEIRAIDAYNGRQLWSYQISGVLKAYDGDHLMGTSGTGSNYCVTGDGVFARHRDFCVRIDARSGQPLGEFKVPGKRSERDNVWGYIASDSGRLYGSRADSAHVVTYRYKQGGDMRQQLTESDLFFAYDVASGKLLWQYRARHSIRHNAIAIGQRYVYLIDRPQAVSDRVKRATAPVAQQSGALIALDKKNGALVWKRESDIYGTTLAVSDAHGVVVMSYQNSRFKLDSELGGRLTAFSADSGEPLWDRKADYQSRLTLMDRTVVADGGAWDLISGKPRKWNFERSYGCGVLSGGKNMLFFRSATLGYFDIAKNDKVQNFGGVRPGCWINAIPAGGLVLVPDASAGCSCSYLNRSWFALEPTGE